MEGLAWKRAQRLRELRVHNPRPAWFAIHRVAHNRPSARGKMRANLMRAAGDQPASEQRQPNTRCSHAAEAHEPGETFRSRDVRCGDLPSIDAVATETQRNSARGDVDTAIDNRKVVLLAARSSQGSLQSGVYRRRLRDEDDARGQLVEPADDRGPVSGCPAPRMPQQRVHQRSCRVRVGGVYDEARGLVDSEEIIVFKENVEVATLSLHRRPGGFRGVGYRDCDDVAKPDSAGSLSGPTTINGDGAVLDPVLDTRPGGRLNASKMPAKYEIDPLPVVAAIGRERADCHRPGIYRTRTIGVN